MIFNELGFVPFLAVVFALFLVLRGIWRTWLLLAASWFFYGVSGLEHLGVLVAGIVWVYLLARHDALVGRTWLLVVTILGPILALVYFKYSGFLVANVAPSAALADESFSLFSDVVLPAGISFFTFQLISFAIDRYRGDIPTVPRFADFALYISFFPQLVAGPILRFDQVRSPLQHLARFRPDADAVMAALGYICFGLAVKVLVADSLDGFLTPLEAEPGRLAPDAAAYVVGAYSFQIYFDFYGYSLIAIGLGRLFGFDFPDNFRRPYSAANPRAFWRRWHITLSYWIRDYLYLPLGGNRSYVRNIAIVFAAAGLWHGAGWTFVIWGLYHALLVIGYHLSAPVWDRLPMLLQQAVNFVLVSIGWLLFLFDWAELGAFASSIGAAFGGDTAETLLSTSLPAWLMLALAATICFGVRIERIVQAFVRSTGAQFAYGGGLGLLLVASLMYFDRSQTFIYFRF